MSTTNKKSKHNPQQQQQQQQSTTAQKQKNIGLTPDEEQKQHLLPLTFIDTAPSGLINEPEITHTIYFLPKVAIHAGEVTEEMAEDIPEEDLYERFRLERSFVVYGVPVTYTTEIVQEIFQQLGQGPIEMATWVIDHTMTNGKIDPLCRVCEVTMIDDDQYQIVLNNNSNITINSLQFNQDNGELMGISKWDAEFNALRPNFTSLQNQVDLFMANFDKRISQEAKAKKRPIIDEDGFTLVVGDDRNVDANEKKFKKAQKQMKKRDEIKQKERLDGQLSMYKVHEQQQHTKKAQQEQHKQTYADKKIINKLKEQRSFNPF